MFGGATSPGGDIIVGPGGGGGGGGTALSLTCSADPCEIDCDDVSPSLTFTAAGGQAPYTWVVTKGDLAESGAQNQTAVFTPPTNSNPTRAGVAYRVADCRFGNNPLCGDPDDTCNNHVRSYECDDAFLSTGICGGCGADCDTLCDLNTQPACGETKDVRTQAMIDDGCEPCGSLLTGAIITVTDSVATEVSIEIAVTNSGT